MNEQVCRKIEAVTGEYDELHTKIKKLKHRWSCLKVFRFSQHGFKDDFSAHSEWEKKESLKKVGRQY